MHLGAGILATGWSAGGVKNFLFSKSSKPILGPTQPPIQRVHEALILGVIRPGRVADTLL
jgi:hypothetical protein